MLLRESGSGADESRLRMGDQLHRHLVHAPFEPALGNEPVAETRAWKVTGQPQANAARNDRRIGTLRQGNVAGYRAEAEAKAVERRSGETVPPLESGGPQFLLVVNREVEALDRAKRVVEVPQSLTGSNAL